MNPQLVVQIMQLLQWAATGLLKIKENDGTDAPFIVVFKQALSENRPLTDEEWAPIETLVTASGDALQDA